MKGMEISSHLHITCNARQKGIPVFHTAHLFPRALTLSEQKCWWVSQGLAAEGSTPSPWKLSYFIPAYTLVNTTTTTLEPQSEGKSRVTACPSHSGIKILKICQGQNCFVCKGCQQDRKGNGSLVHLRLPWIEQMNDPVEHAVCSSHSQHIAWSAPHVRYKQNSPHHLSAPVHIWGNHKNFTWAKLTVPPCPEHSTHFIHPCKGTKALQVSRVGLAQSKGRSP